jgi:hypothetical protein
MPLAPIKLTKPIMSLGEELTELTISEPNFGNLIDSTSEIPCRDPNDSSQRMWRPRSSQEEFLALIASLSGITEAEARKLSIKDYYTIRQVISPFLAL